MSIPDRKPSSSSQLWKLAEGAMRGHAAHSAQDAGRIHELQVQQAELETQNEELRRAYLALDELQSRYFDLFDMAPVGLLTLSRLGFILEVNLHLASRLGVPRPALVGQPLKRYICMEDQAAFDVRCLAFAETGILDHWELRLVDADGGIFWAGLALTVAEEADGSSSYRLVVGDISERKELEAERLRGDAQLRQAEQLRTFGSLAGGIAQDMNDVLGAILGLATVHADTLPKDSPVHHAFEIIAKAAHRGGDMIRSLHMLTRQRPVEEREVDLNALLGNEARLLDRIVLSRVELAKDLAPDLRPILGDASSLLRALLNLCVNAVEAMPEGGTLTLRSRNVDGGRVEIQVQDSGTGMSEAVLARVFDPLFTTKDGGKASGLGLVLVQGIVAAHGGSLQLQSEPGLGTCVTLRFPAYLGGVERAGTAPQWTPAPAGRVLSVLTVDDDDLVQEAMALLLDGQGHQRVAATCGEDAVALVEGGLRPDVVILDLNMPGLGGAKTLALLRLLLPAVPVLLATSRVDAATFGLLDLYSGVHLLSKPFTSEDLRRKLDELVRGF